MKIPSIKAFIRKTIFILFMKIRIMDPIRNFVYAWAWSYLKRLPRSSRVLDIGARNSQFAAFCAWQGLAVTAIDKDNRFLLWQKAIGKKWDVSYEIETCDVLGLDPAKRFDCICAVLSLQHAGNSDVAAYAYAANLLNPGGIFLAVNEFDLHGTRFEADRDDGPLRIYGPQEIADRVEKPLVEAGLSIIEKKFAFANFKKGSIGWPDDPRHSSICFIAARKNDRRRQ